MKKIPLIIVLLLIISKSYSQTLFTYGKYAVTKDEFLRAYNKNKATGAEKPLSMRDYLDLYIKFKLKVQAARDVRLDTLPSIKSDLETSKLQLENNYMQDDAEINALVNEAFQRSQKDLHVQHFYVAINSKMTPADTSNAVKAIEEVYDELKEGKEGYYDIVSEVSEKIAPVKGNDLGWITVFTLPYEYENIVYDLKPGQVSKPYRSKGGWHVFKLEEQRPAAGKITVAQILLAVPNGNIAIRDHDKQLADSIYAALKGGADFGELAKQYSNDRRTYMNKGIMPEFGVSQYDGEFEQEAFALQHDGDISRPFQTTFGFHILKRISRSPIPEARTEAYMASLKQQVTDDSRMSLAKDKFLQKVLTGTGFKKSRVLNEKDFWQMTDSIIVSNKKIEERKINDNSVIFSFNDNAKVTVGDWMQYLKSVRMSSYGPPKKESHEELLKNYISLAALENYRKRLADFSPGYRYQMEEFKDGDMFFEAMQRNVWSKASADTAGLLQYYNDHKENYKWNASADAVLFSCATEAVANAISGEIKNKPWQEVVKDNPQIQTDSGRYELAQIPVNEKINFTPGLITKPVVNNGDGTAVFALILKTYPGDEQRIFADARGLVINDYQNVLEKKWVDELKKKYPVRINESVFNAINH
ncbi:MAG TPA: peptidylprolyl isomerase [Chitinophagaceae bacterium]|nr:peptidylprolyl isomerase [Chitinophagaceae bacterium]